MNVIHTDIEGVIIIEPTLYGDSRGYFFESFSAVRFDAMVGRHIEFVQDNESSSADGVVRGLHFQRAPHAQSKLVRAVRGAILDVAVDIRRGSPTYGKYVAVELSDQNHRQLFIPRGFAHGFAVLRGEAVVHYKCDNYYAPESEGSILWADKSLGIDWGIDPARAIISDKDSRANTLDDAYGVFDYTTDYYA